MKRRTVKDWDRDVATSLPVGLYLHPTGANRKQRRASREHKNDPTPPSSMAPAVKRMVIKEQTIASKHEPMKTIKIPTRKVEYVAAR